MVVSERNMISLAGTDVSSARVRLAHKMVPWVYPWADGIIAVSRGVAEDLAGFSGVPVNRIDVINNPVVTPQLVRQASEAVDYPRFAPGAPPVILGIGRRRAF